MAESGYPFIPETCPYCGSDEFTIDGVSLCGKTYISPDGWDYWSEGQSVDALPGASVTCLGCHRVLSGPRAPQETMAKSPYAGVWVEDLTDDLLDRLRADCQGERGQAFAPTDAELLAKHSGAPLAPGDLCLAGGKWPIEVVENAVRRVRGADELSDDNGRRAAFAAALMGAMAVEGILPSWLRERSIEQMESRVINSDGELVGFTLWLRVSKDWAAWYEDDGVDGTVIVSRRDARAQARVSERARDAAQEYAEGLHAQLRDRPPLEECERRGDDQEYVCGFTREDVFVWMHARGISTDPGNVAAFEQFLAEWWQDHVRDGETLRLGDIAQSPEAPTLVLAETAS